MTTAALLVLGTLPTVTCWAFAAFARPPAVACSHPRRCDAPRLADDEGFDDVLPERSAMLWQEQLERVLSPKTAQADREILLRDLLGRGPEIVDEVTSALSQQDLESLVPPESETQRTLQEIQAVQDQVLEEAMAQANEAQARLSDPERLASDVAQAAQDAPPVLAQAAGSAASVLTSLLSDPAKAAALAQQEARNVVSRTPEGAEMPPYSVVLTVPSFEVRRYQPCSVAAVDIASAGSGALGSGLGPFGGGGALSGGALAAYNALVAYFVGANSDAAAMELTSPVRLDPPAVGGVGRRTLSMMLPSRYTCASAPRPGSEGGGAAGGGGAIDVALRQTAEETLAVVRFSGFATDGEVKRSVRRLEDAIRAEGGVDLAEAAGGGGGGSAFGASAAEGAAILLQYNPPYTLPWLRTNEVALPVVLTEGFAAPPPSSPAASSEAAAASSDVPVQDVAESAAPATPADDAAASDAPGDVEEEVAEYDEDDSAPSDC